MYTRRTSLSRVGSRQRLNRQHFCPLYAEPLESRLLLNTTPQFEFFDLAVAVPNWHDH